MEWSRAPPPRRRIHGGPRVRDQESETGSPKLLPSMMPSRKTTSPRPRVRDRGSENKAYAVVCPSFSGGRRNDGKPIRTPVIPLKPNESRCSGHKCGMARLVPAHCSAVVGPGLRRIGTHDGADQHVPVVCRVARGGSMLYAWREMPGAGCIENA